MNYLINKGCLLIHFQTFVHRDRVEFKVDCLNSGLIPQFYIAGNQPVINLAVFGAVFVMEFVKFTTQLQ